jgi:beta-glucosidase
MKDRTYRYFAGKPLYGFGYGLSYSTFAYSSLKLPSTAVKAGDAVTVECDVKNTSSTAGDEVVELYLTQPRGFETARHELAGFTRIHLEPSQSTHVGITLSPRSIAQVDESGVRKVLPGTYAVSVGGAQPGDAPNAVNGTFTVAGTADLPK